jgi:hypothetical protein
MSFFSTIAQEWGDGGFDDGSGECTVSLPDGGTAQVYLTDRSEWCGHSTQRHQGASVFFRDHYGRAIGWRYPTVKVRENGYQLDFSGHCPAGK